MSKKTWTLIACLVLSLALGLGGSLAYLTDTDTKVNTFTMGKVAIEVEEIFDKESANLKPGIEINKDARIMNTGDNDAWVWMTVAVPEKADPAIILGWYDGIVPEGPVVRVDKDGNRYNVYSVGITTPVKAGESTAWLLDKVTLKPNVDFRDNQYWLVVEGDDILVDYELSDLEIIVTGYAIQADGIGDIATAVQNYGGQWGFEPIPTEEDTTPDQPTTPDDGDDNEPTQPEIVWEEVDNLTKLQTALSNGKKNIALTGNIDIAAGDEVELTLNGVEISTTSANIVNNGTLTIIGGTLKSNATDSNAIISNQAGSLTLDGTTVIGREPYKSSYPISNRPGATLTIKGNSVLKGNIPNKDTVQIEGGTFYVDPTEWVADGYQAKDNGDGTWTVTATNP